MPKKTIWKRDCYGNPYSVIVDEETGIAMSLGPDDGMIEPKNAPPVGEMKVYPPQYRRGLCLEEALKVINGERQTMYGSPEDNFQIIANFWTTYLRAKGRIMESVFITRDDVAMLMCLLKIAREAGGAGSRDNLVDLAGYAGLYADMIHKAVDKPE